VHFEDELSFVFTRKESLANIVSKSTNCVRQKVASHATWKFMMVHTKQKKNKTPQHTCEYVKV
jgi:hypothetical protein